MATERETQMAVVRRRRRIIVAPIAVAALLLTACGGSDQSSEGGGAGEAGAPESMDDLVEAAQAEGTLTLYHHSALETTTEWVNAFTDEYGIEVVLHNAPTNALLERWTQETNADQHTADVLSFADSLAFDEPIEDGWVVEYHPEDGDGYPEHTKNDGYYYPTYEIRAAWLYNTDEVSEEEEQMLLEEGGAALEDERWRGRVAAATGLTGLNNSGMYYSVTQGERGYGWEWAETVYGPDSGTVFYDSGPPMIERVVAGEHAVGGPTATSIIAPQIGAGAPIRYFYPPETAIRTHSVAASANAPHPNAARLFMEWATSVEANERFAELSSAPPLHEDATDRRPFADEPWYQDPAAIWERWDRDEQFLDDLEGFRARWADFES